MKVTTYEELKVRHLGKIGTPERDAYEAEVREAIQSYHIGEAIKAARKERNMTQQSPASRRIANDGMTDSEVVVGLSGRHIPGIARQALVARTLYRRAFEE